MARYAQAFKDRAVARLLPPESAPVKAVSHERARDGVVLVINGFILNAKVIL